jgi:dTDP-4-dehydrorhamnose reductase
MVHAVMNRILVTGGTGQLATALVAAAGSAVIRVGRPEFDFDRPESLGETFRAASPELVINAAAWTAVDAAETNQEAAARANATGPESLARLCADAGIPLIHVSTDYVFDGCKGEPYTEADPTSPTGVYGSTKRAGELAVLAAHPRAIVARTSWVYAATGKNFVRTMLGAARKTSKLRVVADQTGCPTNADDLALALLAIAAVLESGWRDDYAGVVHVAGTSSTTWHGLATATFEAAGRHGLRMPEVMPITTADWPTPAQRPADSRLDTTRLATVFGHRLPLWRSSLERTVDTIFATEAAGSPV